MEMTRSFGLTNPVESHFLHRAYGAKSSECIVYRAEHIAVVVVVVITASISHGGGVVVGAAIIQLHIKIGRSSTYQLFVFESPKAMNLKC